MNEFYKAYNLTSSPRQEKSKPRPSGKLGIRLTWYGGIAVVLIFFGLGPMPPGNIGSASSDWMMRAHRIDYLLQSYAVNHGGHLPGGTSSTEIFQKLLDFDHRTEPSLFYIPLAGKVPPIPGQKLRPESVTFDFTGGIDSTSPPPGVPLVFMTGYRVQYRAEGVATPLTKPYPKYTYDYTWMQWYYRRSNAPPGLAVAYSSHSARFLPLEENGTVAIIPSEFEAAGNTYVQFTPEGVLSQ